jgi:hypothetical protein
MLQNTHINARRRSDLTVGSDEGTAKSESSEIIIAGLRRPWTVSSEIIVKVLHTVDSETEMSVPDCALYSTPLSEYHWG